jgi:hypothetical protein
MAIHGNTGHQGYADRVSGKYKDKGVNYDELAKDEAREVAENRARQKRAAAANKEQLADKAKEYSEGPSFQMGDAAKMYAAKKLAGDSEQGSVSKMGNLLMMTGDPTTMAAGAALSVIGGIGDKRDQARKEQAERNNERKRQVVSALSRVGSGIGGGSGLA